MIEKYAWCQGFPGCPEPPTIAASSGPYCQECHLVFEDANSTDPMIGAVDYGVRDEFSNDARISQDWRVDYAG